MTSTQFSTIIRLFAEQNQYIDRRFDEESKKRTAEHLAITKAVEAPFLEHEARIRRLEKSLLQSL